MFIVLLDLYKVQFKSSQNGKCAIKDDMFSTSAHFVSPRIQVLKVCDRKLTSAGLRHWLMLALWWRLLNCTVSRVHVFSRFKMTKYCFFIFYLPQNLPYKTNDFLTWQNNVGQLGKIQVRWQDFVLCCTTRYFWRANDVNGIKYWLYDKNQLERMYCTTSGAKYRSDDSLMDCTHKYVYCANTGQLTGLLLFFSDSILHNR